VITIAWRRIFEIEKKLASQTPKAHRTPQDLCIPGKYIRCGTLQIFQSAPFCWHLPAQRLYSLPTGTEQEALQTFLYHRYANEEPEMNAIQSLRVGFVTALIGLFIFSSRVDAGAIDSNHLPTITMQTVGAADPWTSTPPATAYSATKDGYALRNTYNQNGVCDNHANVSVQQLEFNADPFVLNNILVTNTTASTQIFSVTVGLPTTFPAPNLISGTITTSVIDGNASGSATVSTVPGNPIYRGQIDFNTVATLQNDPFSVSTPGSGSATNAFGPTVNLIPVTSSIGIQLTFQLTAGDTAAILSRFDVSPIPEPASASTVGGCLLVAASVSRRRR
jgi:hypothetical protein